MIIKAPASTVRSAAKKAGETRAVRIRTGRAAYLAEKDYVRPDECSVRVCALSAGVEDFIQALIDRYGRREPSA